MTKRKNADTKNFTLVIYRTALICLILLSRLKRTARYIIIGYF